MRRRSTAARHAIESRPPRRPASMARRIATTPAPRYRHASTVLWQLWMSETVPPHRAALSASQQGVPQRLARPRAIAARRSSCCGCQLVPSRVLSRADCNELSTHSFHPSTPSFAHRPDTITSAWGAPASIDQLRHGQRTSVQTCHNVIRCTSQHSNMETC